MNTVEQDTRSERDRHCDGLQALVDLLRAHPELDTPFDAPINLPIGYGDDPKAEMAEWAKVLAPLKPTKSYDDWAGLTAHFEDVKLYVYTARDKICERVVVGVETVTKTVKDPEALKAVPDVEVTEDVETVEWICRPFLAGEVSA